ncbi:hypothetical protein [uncultured Rikenella sp.]|uniref:hypothetical protein n=1 Tax=uncultured Rikenella sp. TaxID=368003 RepID=UPI002605D99E|nr:hypothetical protein [uncultured Rikenella sp.]
MGALTNVGNNGYSWSSSFSGTSGVFLNFNTQNLNPSNVNNRGHGLQLRCLSVFIPFAVRFYVIFSLIENNFLDFLFCRLLARTKDWAEAALG